eukprot:jgi/Hompol1/2067/HPOL_004449-RA
MKMIRNWGAHAVVQTGDFDYQDDPDDFMQQFKDVLGKKFPLFAVVGNHDIVEWATPQNGYKALLVKQAEKSGVIKYCTGEYGINMVCKFHDIVLVLSGVGTMGAGHAEFIDQALTKHKHSKWKICVWHKNQKKYQTGDKEDETGYLVYDKNLQLRPGHSFAAVTGLGGESIRYWKDDLEKSPWWAATAAMDNGANFGALLCKFNHNDVSGAATCKFKDIDGNEWDKFHISSTADSYSAPVTADSLSDSRSHSASASQFTDTAIASMRDIATVDTATGSVSCGAAHLALSKRHNTSAAATSKQSSSAIVHTLTFHIPAIESSRVITHAHLQMMAAHPSHEFLKRFSSKRDAYNTFAESTDLQMKVWAITSKPACGNPTNNQHRLLNINNDDDAFTQTSRIRNMASSIDPASLAVVPEQAITWNLPSGEDSWEVGEVFVSPNIAHLINPIINQFHQQHQHQPINCHSTMTITLAVTGQWWMQANMTTTASVYSSRQSDQLDFSRSFYGIHGS